MSRWQSESSSNGGASAADDRVTKQWLSSEKREMLVHYFNHRGDMGVPWQNQPARQEDIRNLDDFDLTRDGHQATSHAYPRREWQDSTDDYQLTTRCSILEAL